VSLVNLRRARKAKARAKTEAQAAENRRRFGRLKWEQVKETASRELETRRFESHRRDLSKDPGPPHGD
jgi:hypothetical protein